MTQLNVESHYCDRFWCNSRVIGERFHWCAEHPTHPIVKPVVIDLPIEIPVTVYAKGPGGFSASDPLDQRRTLGFKIQIAGRQYGLVLGRKTLESMGINLVHPDRKFESRMTVLVEGAAPEEL